MLDLVGYSTAPDDAKVALGLSSQALQWLLSLPLWLPWSFAFAATAWLMYVSWPRHHGNKTSGLQNIEPAPDRDGDIDIMDPELQPVPQKINLLETYFTKKIIRVADLIHGRTYVVEAKTFEDCIIYGPGVVIFRARIPARLIGCEFEGDPRSLFITVDEDRHVIGAVGFPACNFTRCKFIGIGIVDTKDGIEKMFGEIKEAD